MLSGEVKTKKILYRIESWIVLNIFLNNFSFKQIFQFLCCSFLEALKIAVLFYVKTAFQRFLQFHCLINNLLNLPF